ncbi:MAG: hypothetical protein HXS54_16225 [Theionarchaea archaeon]|nr:hypothetical protein [Theionarchaea archaeon]
MPDGDLEFSVTFPVKELEEDDIIESHLIEELEHGRKKKEYYTSIIIIPRIARATMLGFL